MTQQIINFIKKHKAITIYIALSVVAVLGFVSWGIINQQKKASYDYSRLDNNSGEVITNFQESPEKFGVEHEPTFYGVKNLLDVGLSSENVNSIRSLLNMHFTNINRETKDSIRTVSISKDIDQTINNHGESFDYSANLQINEKQNYTMYITIDQSSNLTLLKLKNDQEEISLLPASEQ